MPYQVRVQVGHPYATYSRSGIMFSKTPSVINDDEITDEILDDPNLVVEEIASETSDESASPTSSETDTDSQSPATSETQ